MWLRLARPAHFSLVHNLRLAVESGDGVRIASSLHPKVSVVVDSGESGAQAPRLVQGTHEAVALLKHGIAQPGHDFVEYSVNGQAGLLVRRGGETAAAITVDFQGHLAKVVWIRLHPAVLRYGTRV